MEEQANESLLSALTEIQAALGLTVRRARDLKLQEAVGARTGYEIEGPLYSTMTRLSLSDKSTVSELADQCGVELSTVSRRVQVLEDRGLVQRETPAHDRRSSFLKLSPAGRERFEELSTTWRAMLAEALSDWEADQVAEFAEMYVRFAHALEIYALTITPLKQQNLRAQR